MEAAGHDNTDRYARPIGIERQLVVLLQDHRKSLLEIGSPGRLLLANDIRAVVPLDDFELLEAARPIPPDGKMKLDPQKLTARQDGIVKAAPG